MTRKSLTASLMLLSAGVFAQTRPATPAAAETSVKDPVAPAYYYIDPSPLHLDRILPPPPSRNSAATTAELTELHHIESIRTPAQVIQAEADDQEEDIFIFKTVLGPAFTAEALPLTRHSLLMCAKMNRPPAARSRKSIVVRVPIKSIALCTRSARSTPSPHPIPADTLSPGIFLHLR
jgi:hypothetical protein